MDNSSGRVRGKDLLCIRHLGERKHTESGDSVKGCAAFDAITDTGRCDALAPTNTHQQRQRATLRHTTHTRMCVEAVNCAHQATEAAAYLALPLSFSMSLLLAHC